jgi:hypothetical protein
MTKVEYYDALRCELETRYAWAQDDEATLARYMTVVRESLEESAAPGYQYDGEASKAAWRAVGGKGVPTLKALRALPAD